MTEQPGNYANLPEPSHPFARWGAGAAISIWALAVQFLPNHLRQIGAILTPGSGYLVGLSLDVIFSDLDEKRQKKAKKKEIAEINEKVNDLKELQAEAEEYGVNPQTLAAYRNSINELLERKRELTAQP